MAKGLPGNTNPAYVHGHTTGKFSPTYHSWASMIQRCTNPKRPYWRYYGGKGIKVCTRWLESFSSFLADMGERPENSSLDRINPNGDYEPSNCRWATRKEQARCNTEKRELNLQKILHLCRTPKMIKDLVPELGFHEETIRHMVRELLRTKRLSVKDVIKIGRSRHYLLETGGTDALRKQATSLQEGIPTAEGT